MNFRRGARTPHATRNDAAAPSLARETATVGSSVATCSHCHDRRPNSRLYRIVGVGLRVLCSDCYAALDRLGLDMRAAAA